MLIKNKEVVTIAAAYIEKLGGKSNIEDVDACITRLRLTLKDASIIKDADMMALGASGVIRLNKKNIQVVVGTSADLIVDEMNKLL